MCGHCLPPPRDTDLPVPVSHQGMTLRMQVPLLMARREVDRGGGRLTLTVMACVCVHFIYVALTRTSFLSFLFQL